jgi:predicted outer membrane repeat protein
VAGGVRAEANVEIEGSTVSGNRAGYFAGIDIFNYSPGGLVGKIVNSTVSSNTAANSGGGIFSNIALTLANSTIAFNTSKANATYAAGVAAYGASLTLQSSILASNAAPTGQSDLGGDATTVVTGDHNLVTSFAPGISVPAGVVISTACPQLDPLANNGGLTQTHKLRHLSPAINQGAAGTLVFDQRGAQRTYPDNGQADIGAVEWQPTDVDDRLLTDGFERICDR